MGGINIEYLEDSFLSYTISIFLYKPHSRTLNKYCCRGVLSFCLHNVHVLFQNSTPFRYFPCELAKSRFKKRDTLHLYDIQTTGELSFVMLKLFNKAIKVITVSVVFNLSCVFIVYFDIFLDRPSINATLTLCNFLKGGGDTV